MRRFNDLLTVFLLGGTIAVAAEGPTVDPRHAVDRSSEYAVKAGYVYNFIKFVDWPGEEEAGPIRVCVLAGDPYGESFAPIAERTVKGHRLTLLRLDHGEDPSSCHVVFLSAARAEAVEEILREVDGATVLTVSDAPAFADAGGMIGFVNKGNKIRFEINHEAVRRAGLRMSAKLLELAWIVKD